MKQNLVKQKFNEIEFGEIYFSETEFNETEFGETDFRVGVEIHFGIMKQKFVPVKQIFVSLETEMLEINETHFFKNETEKGYILKIQIKDMYR